jgi:histidinol-phosphatase (PHP family)
MILDAISSGFDVLGFSGHSFTSFDQAYCMTREKTAHYFTEIRQLADKYADRIKVFCGIEQDLFADDSAAEFDYGIGSVHAIFKEYDTSQMEDALTVIPSGIIPVYPNPSPAGTMSRSGFYIYIDWSAKNLEWAVRWIYEGDSLALAEDYFAHMAQVANLPGVQIAGHFDLLTKFEEERTRNGLAPMFDTADPRWNKAAESAITALVSAGKIFEINTGAIARGLRTMPYPSLPLLQQIQAAGGRITINSDCHSAGNLDCKYDLAMKLAREAGFTQRSVLTSGSDGLPEWVEIPL